MGAGATSAIYSGETFEAMPMATPPVIRHATNQKNVGAQPVSVDETANTNAVTSSRFFRPYLSHRPPDMIDPMQQPASAQLFAHPESAWLFK